MSFVVNKCFCIYSKLKLVSNFLRHPGYGHKLLQILLIKLELLHYISSKMFKQYKKCHLRNNNINDTQDYLTINTFLNMYNYLNK